MSASSPSSPKLRLSQLRTLINSDQTRDAVIPIGVLEEHRQSGGKSRPFGPVVSDQEIDQELRKTGLDPVALRATHADLQEQLITEGLLTRMGTDANRTLNSPAAPTLHDTLEAAYEHNSRN